MKLLIPPPVYALLIATAMWALSRYFPVVQIISEPWNRVGIGIILMTGTLDLWSLFLFMKQRTTINPMKPKNTSDLVISGLYKVTRNPMYVGLLLILFGYAVWLGSFSPFFMLPLFYILITEMQIKSEELILEEKFGQDYLNYKNKVRRWL